MTEAARISDLVRSKMPHTNSGTLRFWGSWFGRPYDNLHRVVGSEVDGDVLRLTFDEGEVLTVWSPRRADITDRTFQIGDAERVRWEWFCYGRAKTAENLYFEDFRRSADGVIVSTTNVDWAPLNLSASSAEPAVEIL